MLYVKILQDENKVIFYTLNARYAKDLSNSLCQAQEEMWFIKHVHVLSMVN